MRKLIGYFMLVASGLSILASESSAQPPWGGGGPPFGGGGPPGMGEGGFSGRWGSRDGRDSGRDFGRDGGREGFGGGGFDPSMFLGRMDRNGNGMIDSDEMEGPARFMLERMARSNPKIDLSKPIPLSVITEGFQQMRGGSSSSSSSSDEVASGPAVLVPGFGVKIERPPVPGFGMNANALSIRVEEQDLRDADERIQRYDRNRDSVLDEAELRDGRWSDSPMQYDKNGDGKLTRDELAVRYAKRRMESSGSPSSSGDSRDSRDSRSDRDRQGYGDRGQEEKKEIANPFEKIASYRLTDRDGKPKRPAGLPEWFARYDVNSDNQVAMDEFVKRPSAEAIEDYARFDTNLDGFITARECLAAHKNGFIPGSSSGSGSSSSSSSGSSGATASSEGPGSSGAPGSSGGSSTPGGAAGSASGGAGASQSNSAVSQRTREWMAGRVTKYDKNQDGKLDIDEYKVYNSSGDFTKADTNQDGFADVDELAIERSRR
ncbi:EF hand [Pirellula sp. SH-Sr6A]|nr:EF hand [Pirellula sp. SH-Sr6A]